MSGGSATRITNWGDMQSPMTGSLMNLHNTHELNAGKWAEKSLKADEQWRKQRQKEVEEFRKNQDFWRKTELAIATLQKLAAFYFADKQYQAAKEAQSHQNEVWETEKEWAKRYQDLWFNKYRPIEEEFLKEKAKQKEYTPRYEEAETRALTSVRREFAQARKQARRCIDPRCIGMKCATDKELAIAEARAAVGAINKGYRAEEARKDVKDAQFDEIKFSLLKLGRGLGSDSLNALNSASAAARIAATYKPYAGYEAAVGSLFGEARSWASNQAMSAGQQADIYSRQASAYALGQGYTGNVAAQTAGGFSQSIPFTPSRRFGT